MMKLLDMESTFWMQGDGEGYVLLMCRTCDRRGLPVAIYQGDDTYDNQDVVNALTMDEFFTAGVTHQAKYH